MPINKLMVRKSIVNVYSSMLKEEEQLEDGGQEDLVVELDIILVEAVRKGISVVDVSIARGVETKIVTETRTRIDIDTATENILQRIKKCGNALERKTNPEIKKVTDITFKHVTLIVGLVRVT